MPPQFLPFSAGLPNQVIPAIIIAKEGTASTGGKTDMYTFDSRVRYSETGEEGLLSLPAIVDYFQDVSTFQSEDLGIGIDFLKEKDLLWVMSAWQVVVHRYPALGEKIRIGTIPYELRGFMGLRNFFMDTEGGSKFGLVADQSQKGRSGSGAAGDGGKIRRGRTFADGLCAA